MNDIPAMLDIPHLCQLLCCGKTTAYKLVKEENFRVLHIGKKMLIPRDDVIRFIENRFNNV